MHKIKILGVMAPLALSLAMIGCTSPTKATGGGQITAYSSYESESASFGFNGTSCEGPVTGQFQFSDKSFRIDGGIKFHAQVTDTYFCEDFFFGCGDCIDGEAVVEADYKSTNPFFPGSGEAVICLTDGGQGADGTDTAFVKLYGGPFSGYAIGGTVGGNVQDHGCDDE